jgi:hypothetical protein
MGRKLVDMIEYSLHQAARRDGIVKGNIISDGVEIVKGWLGPDYFSHRAMRCFALA